MIAFDVPDMTCGHCVRAITEAVRAVAPAAQVQVDLASHRVQIGGEAPLPPAEALRAAIADAGYSPAPAN